MTTEAEALSQAVWARILPFLKPIEPLIRDPEISDIMVNGSQAVFIEKAGYLLPVPGLFIPEKSLQVAARNIARALGDDVNEEMPLADSRLPDGSRVAIVLHPISVSGTTLTIRKFQAKRYTLAELVRIGTLTPGLVTQLEKAVRDRRNILIAGGTGTGKTTLLNALAGSIPDDERVVVIEDTVEIQIDKPNLVRLEARRAQTGLPPVTIRDLLRTTLRLRPDRILLGEVRGGEAFDLLQAFSIGHSGALCTLHANSAAETLSRFTSCVLMSGVELPHRAIRSNIADAVHVVIHLGRRPGRRFVTEVLLMKGYDASADRYEFERLYSVE